ncbi:MAG: T9SS type A sorting domain-containing protein [Lewinellaceae bacterium]|nr:T9SS type A sorting domain-containing protein [Lewinellaceae bacterium]
MHFPKKQLAFLPLLFFSLYTIAQDTTVVQTLTWQSDNRSGDFQFPDDPEARYEKILMRYNMRCHDNAVGSGNVGCREWDYSCNTFITDPSMVDSTRTTHPEYVVSGFSGDTFPYTGQPTRTFYEYEQYEVQYQQDSIVGPYFSTGDEDLALDGAAGKIYLLYTAEELQPLAANWNGPTINGLFFFPREAGPGMEAGFLRIRLKHTNLEELSATTPPDPEGFTEVYFRNTPFSQPTYQPDYFGLYFRPFQWDGASNLLVEMSYSNSENSQPVTLKSGATAFPSQLRASGPDQYLAFSGYGAVSPPTAIFQDISQEVTVSFWCKGDPNTLPMNSTLFEGNDAENQRQINVHLPWGNGRVYWDCGNDGNGYDRIDKAADPEDFAGRWNHWAFTKNAATGEMKIYLNGQLWHSGTGKTKPIDIQKMLIGGNVAGTLSYFGAIDEFRIWKKALSETDIRDWMFRTVDNTHPEWAALLAYYPLDEGAGAIAHDASANGFDAEIFTAPAWRAFRGSERFKGLRAVSQRPHCYLFSQVNYTAPNAIDTTPVVISVQNPPAAVIQYGVNGNNALVALDTQLAWHATDELLLDEQGNILDTYPVTADGAILPGSLTYYQKQDARFELLSLVTPYGNGLSLGAQGKTFWFDVTDYAPILRGEKFLSVELGGQYQEELDISFYFIEGVPARDVLSIQNIWPFQRGQFGQIQDDRFFEPRQVPLRADAEGFKARLSITGHEQNGEFTPREHYLNLNGGDQEFPFQVWKACGDIPIYPQGGTWLFDRAGWCPGTPTDVHQFEITDMVAPGSSVEMDYGLNGPLLSSANYLVSAQLVSYGAPNFELDAALESIMRPSGRVEFSRINPACNRPMVVVKNTGATPVTSLLLEYQLRGGPALSYEWTGSLAFLDTAIVELPTPDMDFWNTVEEQGIFQVNILEVNGQADDYGPNNTAFSEFTKPQAFEVERLQFHFRTNLRASENRYSIRNATGDVVLSRENMENSTLYVDDIDLPPGCYSLSIEDDAGDGLYYWYWDAIGDNRGNGQASFRRYINEVIQLPVKSFESEFGSSVNFDFIMPVTVGNQNLLEPRRFSAWPNPTPGKVTVELEGFRPQPIQLQVLGLTGQVLQQEAFRHDGHTVHRVLSLEGLPQGMYIIRLQGEDGVWVREMVKD